MYTSATNKFLFALALAFLPIGLFAQATDSESNREVRGDQYYNDYAFMNARESYIKAVEGGYRSVNVLSRLGDSYYFNGEYEDAAKWYGALFSYSEDIDKEYLYRYAQSLKTLGKYETADRIMDILNSRASADDRGELFSEERNYLKLIELQSGRFNVFSVPFNSELSDYAPTLNGGEIVFTSNRFTRTASQRLHDWNDQPFSELYSIVASEEGEPRRFRDKVNTRFHESSAVFTKDGQTMYFTRNNFIHSKRGKDGAGITNLKLYRSKRTEKGWSEPEELPFNSDNYSVAHPALSADEKTLIFASDMPGGEGASDLYKVSIEEGAFGEPINLGDAVNTEGRETFPFLDSNGDLYFASDGHVGLGGLDIYVAELSDEGNYDKGFNIGAPINTQYDDFCFVINSSTGLGYFASNRPGGKGEDDIYSFEQTAQLIKNCTQALTGEVRDEDTDDLIVEAKVVLLDSDNNVLEETKSDINGKFVFDVIKCSTGYAIRASKENFSTSEKSFVTSGEYESTVKKTLYLASEEDKEIKDAKVGQDLGVILNLNPIYFDLDQSYIRPDAQIELLKVVEAMRKFPTLKIDVRSHTDSRGSDPYNLKLSDSRAKSTVEYIISAGIDRSRVTGQGYGETQLLNRCDDGVPCSEADHQLNRRSEFIIVAK
ncbi:MAG TPA: OmpA family protein [Flavobacteriaceae bacterium]|nr:OmpA family protein [Flavobacteriaceae bacterium]MCB9212336.1 OmpA family protein [Alteromonas sp.]HPF11982.1 OmpA family protein [Flavobacteriaceae bacterium]HQU21439.1 OmpA family protein [Flavobacteriaceae bacterium]HQU65183.1 OmpA family protein [Flavobacteriaceae bacterium]